VWDVEIDEFIEDLGKFVPRRDSIGYQLLVKNLSDKDQVPILREKIWVLVVGRKYESETIVWNLGNICTKSELDKYSNMWVNSIVEELDWNELQKCWIDLIETCDHGYRPGMGNRHGHANVCPSSSWSQGYGKARNWNKTHRCDPKSPAEFE